MSKKTNIEDIYPLSSMQQGLLFHTLYDPQAGLHVEQLVLQLNLSPAFDVEVFKQAWQKVVARHPILRTAFTWDRSEQPLQVVLRQVKLPFERLDWVELAPEEQTQRMTEWLHADRQRGFLLDKAPLLRLCLIGLSAKEYTLIVTRLLR